MLAHSLDTPRFVVDLSVKNELAVSISNGQMEVLKQLGAALGSQSTREKFKSCERPRLKLLPSTALGRYVGGKRPPAAAAAAWWKYAKRCVLLLWREERGQVDWAALAKKATLHEEYTRALTEAYHRRLSTNALSGYGLPLGAASGVPSAVASPVAIADGLDDRAAGEIGACRQPASGDVRLHRGAFEPPL